MVSFNFWSTPSTPSSSAQPVNALPPDHPPVAGGVDQCPVDHTARSKWLEAAESSTPHPFRPTAKTPARDAAALSTDREISSIPRGKSASSEHMGSSEGPGSDENSNWVYPSQQQFYNAMQRKNHNPQARDMRSVVPIHNAVNERAWNEILAWEEGMGGDKCGGPRLISFAGKPKQRTPKAWLNQAMGYAAPFDRHDWIIDRCGTQVRYVIDFYSGRQDPNNPRNMAFFLDVRPALDDYACIETRVKGWYKQLIG